MRRMEQATSLRLPGRRAAYAPPVDTSPTRWRRDALVALCVMTATGLLAASFGQDAGFDVKNYHWYAGHQFFGHRLDLDFAPAQIQGFFNPLIHLPLWLAAHAFSAQGAAVLLGAIHGLGPFLVWKIARRLLAAQPARLAGLLAGAASLVGFVGPIELVSLGTSSGDALMPVFVLGALLLLMPAGGVPSPRAVVASGALIGIAAGLKPTVGMYGVGLLAALLIAPPWTGGRRASLRWAAAAAVGFALVAGPWMVHLGARYGNPVFPLANHLFDSPWAQDFSYGEDRLMPGSSLDFWLFPLRFAQGGTHGWEVPFRDARIAVMAVVGVAFAAFGARSVGARSLRFLFVFTGVAYGIWQLGSSVYRYLGVVELLGPALIVAALVGGRTRGWMRTAGVLLALGALVFIGRSVVVPHLARVPFVPGDAAFGVRLPAPAPEAGSVVLIAGSDALAYIAPSFDPSVRVLRPWSSLSTHDDATAGNRHIAEVLREARGDVFFLEGPNPSVGADVLAYLGYARARCRPVATRVDPDVTLCRLSPLPSRAAE